MGNRNTRPASPPPPPEEKWGANIRLRWTKADEGALREKIRDDKSRSGIILIVFGTTSAGKSSLLNGIRASIRGDAHTSSYFAVGEPTNPEHGSFTQAFLADYYDYFWTVDMPGIFPSDAITDENIEKIASGQVPFYSTIKKNLEIIPGQKTLPPERVVQIACVVIVLKAGSEVVGDVKRQINVVRHLSAKGVLSLHMVLTHIDEIDPNLRDHNTLPNTFQSERVQEAVKYASQQTGISATCISVVKNYKVDAFTNINSCILYLHALDNILHAARETFDRNENQRKMREMFAQGADAS